MSSEKYARLLTNRLWQRRRLEIFNEAEWRCEKCSNNNNEIPLHAHHTLYIPGRAPWEYQHGEIISLCDPCHSEEHGKRPTDPHLVDLQIRIEKAHKAGDWDTMMALAADAQYLIDNGFFYRGLT